MPALTLGWDVRAGRGWSGNPDTGSVQTPKNIPICFPPSLKAGTNIPVLLGPTETKQQAQEVRRRNKLYPGEMGELEKLPEVPQLE